MSSLFMTGCSKVSVNDLIDTYWTGSFVSSDYSDGQKDDLSIDFFTGKADFTYLKYGEQYPETGVLLYEVDGQKLTLTKANEILDGEWNIDYHKGKDMTLSRNQDEKQLTITLRKRR